jgi:histidinol-phosphate aminotransferase
LELLCALPGPFATQNAVKALSTPLHNRTTTQLGVISYLPFQITSAMSTISRRNWFKSTVAFSTGLALAPWMNADALPMSKAEEIYFGGRKGNGGKVRLNSNENPYGPSPKAKKAVTDILSMGNRYQFEEIKTLRKILADKEGVDPSYIAIGSGSGELLFQTGVAYGLEGGSVLSCFPTFPLLLNAAVSMNARWDKVDLNEKLEYDYDKLAGAIKPDTKLVVVCNPNNPTGTYVDSARVKAFCQDVSARVPVFADEAYLEFLDPKEQVSMVDLVKNGANVIVSRTFSKIYGLAGLRIGYTVARPEITKKIIAYGDEISASQTAIAAAEASLGDEGFMSMVRSKNADARKVLTDYLSRKGYLHGNSRINVVFFPAPSDGKTILARCEEKGYLIRIWDYQNKEWCRVSIGTAEEMKGFVKAFEEVTT